MKNLSEFLNSRNLYSALIHIILVALAVQVFVLSRQNRQLKGAQSSARNETVKVGDEFSLSGIAAVDGVARLDSISYIRVFFVFTTHCPFCKQTFPLWDQVVHGIKRSQDVTFIGICLDKADVATAFVKEQKPLFPVFVAADGESFIKTHKVNAVPQTIVTSSNGRVLRVWNGGLAQEKLDEVMKAISDSATIQNP